MAKANPKLNKLRNILLAVIPGLVIFGLVFAANTYYDLDLQKVIIEEVTRIVGQLESTATTTLATLSGYVGVGTTTPAYTLDVYGDVRLGTSSASQIFLRAGTTTIMNGNVGIGTSTPAYKLDVVSGGATTARFGTSADDEVIIGGGLGKLTVGVIDPWLILNTTPTSTLHIRTSATAGADDIVFQTGGDTDTVRIIEDGGHLNIISGNLQMASTSVIDSYRNWQGVEIPISKGGTGTTTAAGARTNLGLIIGTDVQAYNTSLAAIAAGTWTGASSITTLGTIGTGTWDATAIPVSKGGTGSAYFTVAGPTQVRTYTFPDAAETIATLGQVQTFTGNKTFSGTVTFPATINFTSQGSIVKSGNHALTLTTTATTNATIPSGTVTLADLGSIQTFSGAKTFSATPLTLSAASAVLSFSSATGDKQITTGGTTNLAFMPGGKVGIGTTTPAYLLDVWGNANIGTSSASTLLVGLGVGKLTAGTIDPPYTITGEGKYATYAPSMTGVHEETTGIINLTLANEYDYYYSYVIDFNNLEKDSNLWLFYRVTDFGENWQKLAVLLSGEGPEGVWYEKNPSQNQLIIYGHSPASVSFRLTSPRFDWRKHLNVRENGDIVGGLIEEVINDQYTLAKDSDDDAGIDQEQSLFDKFVSKVKEALAFLGMVVEDGIARLTRLFAKEICLEGDDGETICLDKNQLKDLLQGSSSGGGSGSTGGGSSSGGGEEPTVEEEPVAEEELIVEENPPDEEEAVVEESVAEEGIEVPLESSSEEPAGQAEPESEPAE